MKKPEVFPPCETLIFGDSAFARGLWGRLLQTGADEGTVTGSALMLASSPDAPTDTAPRYTLQLLGRHNHTDLSVDRIAAVTAPDKALIAEIAENNATEYLLWSAPVAYTEDGSVKPENALLDALTMLLFSRFCQEKGGYTLIAASFDDANGQKLKSDLLAYASLRGLGLDFLNWVELKMRFIDSFTDFCVCEKSFSGVAEELTVRKDFCFYLNRADGFLSEISSVTVQEDLSPLYTLRSCLREGTLTACCAYALLHNVETVHGLLGSEKLARHLTVSLFEEILPYTDMDFQASQAYAQDMLERFAHPHFPLYWADFKSGLAQRFAKVLVPLMVRFSQENEKLPKHLTFALFCTLQLYRSEEIRDRFGAMLHTSSTAEILADRSLWGADLSDLLPVLQAYEDRL